MWPLVDFLQLRRQCGVSHEVPRGLREPLVWRQENPVFHSSCELELGIPGLRRWTWSLCPDGYSEDAAAAVAPAQQWGEVDPGERHLRPHGRGEAQAHGCLSHSPAQKGIHTKTLSPIWVLGGLAPVSVGPLAGSLAWAICS